MTTPTSEIDFARTPDRAMVLGIAGLGTYLLGCGCGMVMGVMALPVWLIAGGLGGYGYVLGKQALEEIEAGEWDVALRGKAENGKLLGAIAAGLGGGTTLLLGGLFCLGMIAYVVMVVIMGASGGF